MDDKLKQTIKKALEKIKDGELTILIEDGKVVKMTATNNADVPLPKGIG